MTTPIIAPPSTGANKSDIMSKLQSLAGGLAQGKSDLATLGGHSQNWATYTDAQKLAASNDLIAITTRLVQDVIVLAVGVTDIIGAESIIPK